MDCFMWICISLFGNRTDLVYQFVESFHLSSALGCLGVMCLCWNPVSRANSENAWEVKGGPLSVWIVCGTPWMKKIFFLSRSFKWCGFGKLYFWVPGVLVCKLGQVGIVRLEMVRVRLPPPLPVAWLQGWKVGHFSKFCVACCRGSLAFEPSLYCIVDLSVHSWPPVFIADNLFGFWQPEVSLIASNSDDLLSFLVGWSY